MIANAGTWTHITALGGFIVLVRLVCFINQMHHQSVPHRVILACWFFALGAAAVCLSPLQGTEFQWRDALLVWGAAAYVWLDRRRPVTLPGKATA